MKYQTPGGFAHNSAPPLATRIEQVKRLAALRGLDTPLKMTMNATRAEVEQICLAMGLTPPGEARGQLVLGGMKIRILPDDQVLPWRKELRGADGHARDEWERARPRYTKGSKSDYLWREAAARFEQQTPDAFREWIRKGKK